MSETDKSCQALFVRLGYGILSDLGKEWVMNRLNEIRAQLGMSLEEVAAACVPPTTAKQIQRLEKGERKITPQWIKRLRPAIKADAHEVLPELLSPKLKKLLAVYEELNENNKKLWLNIGASMKDE